MLKMFGNYHGECWGFWLNEIIGFVLKMYYRGKGGKKSVKLWLYNIWTCEHNNMYVSFAQSGFSLLCK